MTFRLQGLWTEAVKPTKSRHTPLGKESGRSFPHTKWMRADCFVSAECNTEAAHQGNLDSHIPMTAKPGASRICPEARYVYNLKVG